MSIGLGIQFMFGGDGDKWKNIILFLHFQRDSGVGHSQRRTETRVHVPLQAAGDRETLTTLRAAERLLA